jgi:ribosomal protein S19E (S16A)
MWEDSPEYQEYLNKENEHTNQTKAYYVRLVSLLRNQAEEVTADRCVAEYGPGGGNKTAKVSDALESTAADAIEQLIKMLPKNSLSE